MWILFMYEIELAGMKMYLEGWDLPNNIYICCIAYVLLIWLC